MRKTLSMTLSVVVAALSIGHGQTRMTGTDAPSLFERGMNALEGSSATRSPANALDYLRRSADLGYAPAQVVLGYLHETGRRVTMDARQGFDWYKKAAQQDDPLAEWLAARAIYAGEVPPRDLNEAAKWLGQASAHDNPFAEYLLGRIALDRSNYAEAARQFRKAAEQGLPQAQLRLAKLLGEGRGVPLDEFEAYVWMLVARENGIRVNDLDPQPLEADLSNTQVEQAKSEARELESRATRSITAHGCTGWPGEFDDIPAPPPPEIQRFCR